MMSELASHKSTLLTMKKPICRWMCLVPGPMSQLLFFIWWILDRLRKINIFHLAINCIEQYASNYTDTSQMSRWFIPETNKSFINAFVVCRRFKIFYSSHSKAAHAIGRSIINELPKGF